MFTLVARILTNQGQQLVIAGLLLTVSQTVVARSYPYLERSANHIELLVQTVLIFCMLVSSLYFTGEPTEDPARQSAAAIVFVLLFCSLLAYIFAITWAQCCVSSEQMRDGDEQVDSHTVEQQGRHSIFYRFSSMFGQSGVAKELPAPIELSHNRLSTASLGLPADGSSQRLSTGKGFEVEMAEITTEFTC